MRTLVLAAGVLLLAALMVILAAGKWKNLLNRRDLPHRLGVGIQEEANGFTYTQSHGGRTLFKIHASRVVQLKDNRAVLHDVKIELYGEDGSRVDRIEGNEFEWDQTKGTANAAGPVEITLMRPSVAPAIAPKAKKGQAAGSKGSGQAGTKPLAAAAETAASGEIHVKTSGLTFDNHSGVAATSQRVDFSMTQGNGSSMGATYDSQEGLLVLDREVELTTRRGGERVEIRAQHAEFEREGQWCRLRAAAADYRDGEATAGEAKILFREDGSAARLDAAGGFTLVTATDSHLAAPRGSMEFDEHNQPRHGHMEGGVTMDSARQAEGGSRQMHGTAPTAELEFTAQGELRRAHLERGVEMRSEELSEAANGPLRVSRTWRSPLADLEFRDAGHGQHGQIELATIYGTQGVVITSESQRGKGAVAPSRLAADEMTGEFGPDSHPTNQVRSVGAPGSHPTNQDRSVGAPASVLTEMTGVGHASMEETTASGIRQTSSGDRLEAHFAHGGPAGARGGANNGLGGSAQVEWAAMDGHVALVQQPAARPGAPAEAPLRATAGRAVYEGAGAWLRLTLNPRVEDGGLELAADKIDVSQDSGDAFAHGNVKATWVDMGEGKGGQGKPGRQGSVGLGGQGPAHAIAAEAQLRHTAGGSDSEATFRGHARLWQQANSVAGPVIVLDRQKRTLAARSTDAAEPVRAVLVSAAGPSAGKDSGREAAGKPSAPSVIRVRGGDLKYSDAERKAVMRGGGLGTVVAETGTATSVSNEVELTLLPAGNHAGKDGGEAHGEAQVDRMTARGHVTVTFEGRRGTGEQLVYSSETGDYVLTGTAAAPPKMSDPARGTVTGEALIFHSRDDSVSVEGGGRKTTTDTTAPK